MNFKTWQVHGHNVGKRKDYNFIILELRSFHNKVKWSILWILKIMVTKLFRKIIHIK